MFFQMEMFNKSYVFWVLGAKEMSPDQRRNIKQEEVRKVEGRESQG